MVEVVWEKCRKKLIENQLPDVRSVLMSTTGDDRKILHFKTCFSMWTSSPQFRRSVSSDTPRGANA